ncbi:hypothetical protein [Desulfosporosinus lacus]|uniref:IrrE N-terminal-like domain-containing protein n=1 Tax=Desulfosporosinus lacus DSM 15449 TaxID=1121420 RepID=A0A1M5Q553_9FIRM|nr:hypothetical protein [Desulfosporosinus lacus]SHH09056.1 hypothetical protein SAMN02746098_00141 [Desulfosporosinus lacus DSM 15449]
MGVLIDLIYENPIEAMATHDIKVHKLNLCADIAGFVYKSRKDIYHIVINSNLNWQTQTKVFLHEVSHIENDLPKVGYIVGLDMRHDPMEIRADWEAKVTAKSYGY